MSITNCGCSLNCVSATRWLSYWRSHFSFTDRNLNPSLMSRQLRPLGLSGMSLLVAIRDPGENERSGKRCVTTIGSRGVTISVILSYTMTSCNQFALLLHGKSTEPLRIQRDHMSSAHPTPTHFSLMMFDIPLWFNMGRRAPYEA